MNFFERVLYALQYEVTRPVSYGAFHICWLVASIILIIFLAKHKEKNHEKTLKVILATYGIIAFILELLKQLIWAFNYDAITTVVTWDYQWYSFPFQLCTTPIFISLICLFLKKEKLRNNLLSFMTYVTLLGSVATALYPESCFVKTLLVDIHTMYLHIGSLVVSIYLLVKKEVIINFKNVVSAYFVFLVFASIAESLNLVIYHSGILNGETFNMFFISPYFISTLPVYESVQSNYPFILYILFYLITIFIGAVLVFVVAKIVSRIGGKIYEKNRKRYN